MARFLVDENLPRSLVSVLQEHNIAAVDVRDVGLRGQADENIYEYAQNQGLIVLTSDLGFGNILRYPPGTHHGMIIIRVPDDVSASSRVEIIRAVLTELRDDIIANNVIIIEPGRIRLHTPPVG